MNSDSRIPPDTTPTGWHGLLRRPSSRLGLWSAALAATSVVLNFINSAVFMRLTGDAPWRRLILPFYGIVMMGSALAGGIVGLIALTRRHERSLFVWLALALGLFAAVFILGEFLVPH